MRIFSIAAICAFAVTTPAAAVPPDSFLFPLRTCPKFLAEFSDETVAKSSTPRDAFFQVGARFLMNEFAGFTIGVSLSHVLWSGREPDGETFEQRYRSLPFDEHGLLRDTLDFCRANADATVMDYWMQLWDRHFAPK